MPVISITLPQTCCANLMALCQQMVTTAVLKPFEAIRGLISEFELAGSQAENVRSPW